MLSSVRQSLTKNALESISKRCSNSNNNSFISAMAAVSGVADVRRGFHSSSPRWKHGGYSSGSGDGHHDNNTWYGTTIICVRKNGKVCMIGDGQVTQGNTMVKGNARKIRRIKSTASPDVTGATPSQGTIVGFAGSTADAFTLLDRLEEKLEEYPGQLDRACVELAKGWRLDKYLRRLDAAVLVANERQSFEVTGVGDVLESPTGILGIGSGSDFAIAAARALMDIPELSAEDVARKAMTIASDMCIYTNSNFTMETLDNIEAETTEVAESMSTTTSEEASQPKADEGEKNQQDETKKEDDSDSDDSDDDKVDGADKEEDDDDNTKK